MYTWEVLEQRRAGLHRPLTSFKLECAKTLAYRCGYKIRNRFIPWIRVLCELCYTLSSAGENRPALPVEVLQGLFGALVCHMFNNCAAGLPIDLCFFINPYIMSMDLSYNEIVNMNERMTSAVFQTMTILFCNSNLQDAVDAAPEIMQPNVNDESEVLAWHRQRQLMDECLRQALPLAANGTPLVSVQDYLARIYVMMLFHIHQFPSSKFDNHDIWRLLDQYRVYEDLIQLNTPPLFVTKRHASGHLLLCLDLNI